MKPVAAWMIMAIVAGMAVVSCMSVGGSAPGSAKARVDGPSMSESKPEALPGLHNVVAYHEGFWSGSAPEADEGFETLAALGVKTVISVDGAAPDVEAAARHGIRYVHLPIGYNGFDEARKLQLVRATRDAMRHGPVYMHCHHGKHRSAGAAGTVAVSLGWMTNQEAVARMEVSGTAKGYKGLYGAAASACVLSPEVIDAVDARFPSRARPQGFVKTMVEMDELMDRLATIERAGWKTPAEHPDLVPVAVAGQLVDLLRVSAEGDRAKSKPADFAASLLADSAKAQVLEDMLAKPGQDPKAMSDQLKAIGASCKECHAKYRD